MINIKSVFATMLTLQRRVLVRVAYTMESLGCVWAHASLPTLGLGWDMCVYDPANDLHISRSIVKSGQWETDLVETVVRALQRGGDKSLLVDIGGNIGYYALAAATSGHEVEVFEPVPANAARLQMSLSHSVALQRLVTLHTVALGQEGDVGEVVMAVSRDSNQGGLAHVSTQKRSGSTMLPRIPLDHVLRPVTDRPVYLKIDIEGGECDATRGMRRFVNSSSHILGVTMEFAQSRQTCCAEWKMTGGFFDTLHRKHGLCPQGVPSYNTVCESNAWDLVWAPCRRIMFRTRAAIVQ
jgi:FkbM family methyltransferase